MLNDPDDDDNRTIIDVEEELVKEDMSLNEAALSASQTQSVDNVDIEINVVDFIEAAVSASEINNKDEIEEDNDCPNQEHRFCRIEWCRDSWYHSDEEDFSTEKDSRPYDCDLDNLCIHKEVVILASGIACVRVKELCTCATKVF